MNKVYEGGRPYGNGSAKEITFIVTKDCQLACKYCYEVGKNKHERMDFDTARKAIDYILEHQGDKKRILATPYVVFDFIGGEPLLEVELIERICDYIEKRLIELDSPWKDAHMYSLTTNGINYGSEQVQRFITRYLDRLHVTLTIDGTKRKHDMNRVWKSDPQRGSYDDVIRNIPLWLSQFPQSPTKVTICHSDLPYIHESVTHLFSLGIRMVNINCVYEDVWEEGDDVVFENQLKLLADSMIEHEFWRDHFCSFFQEGIGRPLDSERHNVNCCGAGRMLAVDAAGIFYPCIRLAGYSLRSKPPRILGNVEEGIDPNRIRPFLMLERTVQSSKECIECEVASGCMWCQGENYDCSASGTIFHRSTAICKMHKARVRANRYYWRRLAETAGIEERAYPDIDDSTCRLQKEPSQIKQLTLLLDDTSAPSCHGFPKARSRHLIGLEDLIRIRDLMAHTGDMTVIVSYPDYPLPEDYQRILNEIPHRKIAYAGQMDDADMEVIDSWKRLKNIVPSDKVYSLTVPFASVNGHLQEIDAILRVAKRLMFRFDEGDLVCKQYSRKYEEFLGAIGQMIEREWCRHHLVRCNLLTDELILRDRNQCGAGDHAFTLAPDGKYYVCPAFYFSGSDHSCGDIRSGLSLPDRQLYQADHSKVCRTCPVKHCKRCVYDNLNSTGEVNTPSYEQCRKAFLERRYSKLLYDELDRRRETPCD